MDRQLIYPGQIPLETDLLNTNKNVMIALAKTAAAILGTTTQVNGLSVVPTGPASLQVFVNPGEIYSLQNIDNTAYSSIAADTTHSILKQGISLNQVTLSCAAPGTGGQSINYLIEASYQDTDALPVVLPYYNASNPSTAYSGPANAGTTNNTVRQGTISLIAKAGTAAATGSQTTPAVDAGYTALFVVTVANAQTQIIAGNIVAVTNAPFISPAAQLNLANVFTQLQSGVTPAPLDNSTKYQTTAGANLAGSVVGTVRNAKMVVTTVSASATFTADEVVVETVLGGAPRRLSSYSQVINLATTGAGGMDTGAAPVSGFVALYAIYNPTSQVSALLATNATAALQANIYGGANMPAGYTASALISVWPTNGSSQFVVGMQNDRVFQGGPFAAVSTTTPPTTNTSLSIAGAVPKNAKAIMGYTYIAATTSNSYGITISAESTGIIGQLISSGYCLASGSASSFISLQLITQQTMYYYANAAAGATFAIYITGYTF